MKKYVATIVGGSTDAEADFDQLRDARAWAENYDADHCLVRTRTGRLVARYQRDRNAPHRWFRVEAFEY